MDNLSKMFKQVNAYTQKQLNPHQRKMNDLVSNGMGGF